MAQAGTPVVRDGMLYLPASQLVPVGSAAWFDWLAQAALFSYHAQPGSYRLTLRKEKRRNTHYWYAYLKHDGKLYNAYAGQSTTLTGDHLQQLGRRLLEKAKNGQADRG